MSANAFLERYGFVSDPFEFTNAEQEPLLDEYFVPPPYFPTVLGDPRNPRANIVLAPRGAGKTAQRLMIERNSESTGRYLCVRYDSFPQPAGLRLEAVDWSYHAAEICKLVLLGVLVQLDQQPELADRLSQHQKSVLKFEVNAFLGSLSAEEFQRSLSSVKNFGDKAKDLWDRHAGPLAVVVEAILRKIGIENVDIPQELTTETRRDESLRYHLKALTGIVQTIGLDSTYLLVDKVDEIALTSSDAAASFRFISPLLLDLPTLETPGLGIKFFLWDRIKADYRSSGGRPDRVPIHELEWSVGQLEQMLTERLQAHSEKRVRSLNDLLCADVSLDVHRLVAILASGSPRDMIRTANRIISEQTRTGDDQECLEEAAIWAGIRVFSEEKAEELVPRAGDLDQLRRVGSPTFTVNRLANDIFRVTTQAARNKVQNWMNAGFAVKVGELPNKGNRPLHLYGVTDLRLAIAMRPAAGSRDVLESQAFLCPSCGAVGLTAETEHTCVKCGSHFSPAEVQSVLRGVMRSGDT